MDIKQMMADRAALLVQIQELTARADALDASIKNAARLQIRALMLENGLSVDQLMAPTSKAKPLTSRDNTPLYRDPASGKTWTGHGRAPGWIANAPNRDTFRVSASM